MEKRRKVYTGTSPYLCLAAAIVFVLFSGLSSGCKKSSGSDYFPITPTPESVDCEYIAGTWETSEVVDATGCGEGIYTEDKTYEVVQNGCNITVTDEYGNDYSGSIANNQISWSGSFPQDDGITTINSLTLTLSDDGLSFEGSASWTWSDGIDTCNGTTQIQGTRTSGGEDLEAPSIPAGLTATAVSSSRIDLAWMSSSDNVGVIGYNIYRNGQFLISTTHTSYSDTGLLENTQYCYTVSAYDAGVNESDQSTSVCDTTQNGDDIQAPSVPAGLSVNAVSSSRIDLAWMSSSDNVGVTGYNIYRDGQFLISTINTSYSDTGLSEDTQYCYRVSAYDGNGNESALSTSVCDTTGNGDDILAPSVPSGLSVTALSSSRIDLSWIASTDNVGVTGYNIYRDGQFLISALNNSYSDTGLSEDTQYCYRVSAYDGNGNESSLSTSVCDTTDPSDVPPAPSDLTATPLSSTTIRLAWTDNADNETGFRINIRPTGSFIGWDVYAGMNVTQYDLTTLNPSTGYHFNVYAYNTEGESDNVYAYAMTPDQPSSTNTFLPVLDNAIEYSSLDSTTANTYFSSSYLGVGHDFIYNALYGWDTHSAASLLYFDVNPTIQGTTIVRATLRIYPIVLPGDWNTVYRVYALSAPWSGSVTWNTCPNWWDSQYAEQNLPVTTAIPMEWDVTQIVQRWADNTWNNYGFIVWDPNYLPWYLPALRIAYFESMDEYNSLNRRPELEIEFR